MSEGSHCRLLPLLPLLLLTCLITWPSLAVAQKRNVTLGLLWNSPGMALLAQNLYDRIFKSQLNAACNLVNGVNDTGVNFAEFVQKPLLDLKLANQQLATLQATNCLFLGSSLELDTTLFTSVTVPSGVSDLAGEFASMKLHSFGPIPLSTGADGIWQAVDSAFSIASEPNQKLVLVLGDEFPIRSLNTFFSNYGRHVYSFKVTEANYREVLKSVQATNVQNIVLAADSKLAEAFLTGAFHSFMLEPNYRWLFFNTRLVDQNDFAGFTVISRNITSMEFGPISTAINNNLTLIREIYLYDLLSIWNVYLKKIVCNASVELNSTYDGMTGSFKLNPDGSVDRLDWRMSFYRGLGGERQRIGNWSSDGSFSIEKPENRVPTDEVLIKELKKNKFKVVTLLSAPYVSFKKGFENATNVRMYDRLEGFLIDTCKYILKNLTITDVEFFLQPDGNYGESDAEGNWNGVVNTLMQGQANLACLSLSITTARSQVISYTEPLISFQLSILYKKVLRNPLDSMFEFMRPFHMWTWLLVVASVLVLAVVLAILHRFSRNAANFSLYDSIFFSFASLIQGITGTPPDRPSGQLVIAVYWLFAFVVLVSYVSNYAAMRLLDNLQSEITSLSSLLSQSTYTYGVLANSSLQTMFETSSTTTMQQVNEHMSESPETRMLPSLAAAIEQVSNSTYAFINDGILNFYYSQKICDSVSTGGFGSDSIAFGIPKTAEYEGVFTRAIDKVINNGERDRLFNKYFTISDSEKPNCRSTTFPEVIRDYIPSEPTWFHTKSGALTLSNTLGIAVINVVGCVLTLLLALVEFAYAKCQAWWRRRRTQKTENGESNSLGLMGESSA